VRWKQGIFGLMEMWGLEPDDPHPSPRGELRRGAEADAEAANRHGDVASQVSSGFGWGEDTFAPTWRCLLENGQITTGERRKAPRFCT
jgi:hypothetical protein